MVFSSIACYYLVYYVKYNKWPIYKKLTKATYAV